MKLTAVILAAGLGKRMCSSTPKVLHTIANATLLEILLTEVSKIAIDDVRVVTSSELESHPEFKCLKHKFKFTSHLQNEQKGTAHAASQALDGSEKNPVLVLYGDAPLITFQTLRKIISDFHSSELDVLNVAFNTNKPQGYGRLLLENGNLMEIIEEKHLATYIHKAEDIGSVPKQIANSNISLSLCNSGIYMLSPQALKGLRSIEANPTTKEMYLTDIIKVSNEAGLRVSFTIVPEKQVYGINTQLQRSVAERVMHTRLVKKALRNGTTISAPETVFLSYDTKIGKNVTIHQHVVIGKQVTIDDGSHILPFTHIESAKVGSNTSIGPFTRLRPGTDIGANCKIGNFVEVKSASFGNGSKVSHLSYIGDAEIGDDVNIGAGTVFCNYDGFKKHSTTIGSGTSIGANTSLIAPINIGSGVIVAAGTVMTDSAEDDSLVIARSKQENFKQKAQLIRIKKAAKHLETLASKA